MNDLAASLNLAAPEEVLASGTMVLLMLGTFRGNRALLGLTLGAVVIYAVAAFGLLNAPMRGGLAFGGLYIADGFSTFLKVLILGGAAAASVLALPYMARAHNTRFEYPVLIMLSALGMCIMVSADNLLSLYIGLELQSLAAYILAAFNRSEARSSEAGLKYFLLGALASGILLYGISLAYGFGGTTGFEGLRVALTGQGGRQLGAIFGLVFILAGLAFKVAAVPFHMWTPDVYEGAPTPVAAFFASAPKAAAMGLLVRVMIVPFGGMGGEWRQVVTFMAIASMFLGAAAAIGQTNIKRLLAYSSINNVGFALIGLAAGTEAGVSAVLFYMAVYIVMTLGAFLVVMQMRGPDGEPVEDIASLSGQAWARPGLAFALGIFMFSLAGIPPLLGFFPKLGVFNAAIDADLYGLAVAGVLASVIGAYYYLRIIKVMVFDEPGPAFAAPESRVNTGLLAAAAVFCSPLGLFLLGPLGIAARNAAATLF